MKQLEIAGGVERGELMRQLEIPLVCLLWFYVNRKVVTCEVFRNENDAHHVSIELILYAFFLASLTKEGILNF